MLLLNRRIRVPLAAAAVGGGRFASDAVSRNHSLANDANDQVVSLTVLMPLVPSCSTAIFSSERVQAAPEHIPVLICTIVGSEGIIVDLCHDQVMRLLFVIFPIRQRPVVLSLGRGDLGLVRNLLEEVTGRVHAPHQRLGRLAWHCVDVCQLLGKGHIVLPVARLCLEHPWWTLRFHDHIQRRRSSKRVYPILHSELLAGSRRSDRVLPSWSGSLHRPCKRLARTCRKLVLVAAAAVAPCRPVAHLDCGGGVFSPPSQLRRLS